MTARSLGPPLFCSILTMIMVTVMWVLGKLRDIFANYQSPRKPGYAPIREKQQDFYSRRFYGRMHDCWNRPISSAPDAWIDVVEREDIQKQRFQPRKMSSTGRFLRCLNLGSYNYLGFAAADEYCTPRALDTLTELGISTCAPREPAGTTAVHAQLETCLAEFLGVEAALTFGMGFATNSATLPAIAGKGTLVLSDALNHASIVAGARSSHAKVKIFKHNNAGHLEKVLRLAIAEGQPRTRRPWKKIIIVVEGIYSMEGEICNLKEIVAVKNKYKAYLYLDEAHSIGALGATGRGVCEHTGVDPKDIDILMGTFTKSFGSCGGYIAGSRHLVDFLRLHSPAHLYATSMSPSAAQQVLSALKLLNGDDGTGRGRQKVAQLHDNANYVRRRLLEMGLDVLGDWDSPVMPIMIYHLGKLPAFSRLCLAQNVAVVVVGFPATELLLSRTRICISASHTREDLDYGLQVIQNVVDTLMLQYKDVVPQAVTQQKFVEGSHYSPHLLSGKAVKVDAFMDGVMDAQTRKNAAALVAP